LFPLITKGAGELGGEGLKVVAKYFCLLIPMLASVLGAEAKAQITSITLGPEQIGTVKTAASITTKISFPEKVSSVICGDLYDGTSGKGTFVIQQSDNDVFIKPIAPKGQSNMFVKTSDGKKTYNFDLVVVPFNQAHRVINVLDQKGGIPSPENPPVTGNPADKPNLTDADLEKRKTNIVQAAQTKADEIIRKAREDAMRITNEAETRAAEVERQSSGRLPQEAERRFVQAMLGGIQRADVKSTRVEVKKIIITLDPNMYTFYGKAHLRYTIQNTGDKDFSFTAIVLEAGVIKAAQPIPVEVNQSKSENSLAPTENLSGVVIFDAKLIADKDRLVLSIRGEDNVEIAKLVIQ
jgi:vacuolar-type H+-ATPase subunit H